jgi:hypothetical protein
LLDSFNKPSYNLLFPLWSIIPERRISANNKNQRMKKFLPFLSIVVLAACNQVPVSDKSDSSSVQPQTSQQDTTGLAAYQAWKAQNELGTSYAQPVAQPAPAPAPKPIVKTVYVKQKPQPAPVKQTESTQTSSSSSNGDVAGTGSGTATSDSQGEAKASEKKGISKAAKGAVIGGVVGAGGGYGVGRTMDKKDGRIEYSYY